MLEEGGEGFGGAVKQADFGTIGCCLSHYRVRKVPSRELQMQEIHRGLQLPWLDMWTVLSGAGAEKCSSGIGSLEEGWQNGMTLPLQVWLGL